MALLLFLITYILASLRNQYAYSRILGDIGEKKEPRKEAYG
jgi:hypothetical protein